MKTLITLFIAVSCFAQVRFNSINIGNSSDRTQTGQICFEELRPNGLNRYCIAAPLAMGENGFMRWPENNGAPGDVLTRTADDGTTWASSAFSVPLNLTSDTSPQLIIKNATNTNNQLLIGFDGAGPHSDIQSVTQGTAFRPLRLNPSGGGVSVGWPGVSGSSLRVIGQTDTDGVCVRDPVGSVPGWCFKSQEDTGVFSLYNQTTGNAVFETDRDTNDLTSYKNLLPLVGGSYNLGSSSFAWLNTFTRTLQTDTTSSTVGTAAMPFGMSYALQAVARSGSVQQKQIITSFSDSLNGGSIQSVHQGVELLPTHISPSGGGMVVGGLGTGSTAFNAYVNGGLKSRGLQFIDGSGTLSDVTAKGGLWGVESTGNRVVLRKTGDSTDELIRFETVAGTPSITRIAGDVSPVGAGGTLGQTTNWATISGSSVRAGSLLPIGSASIGDLFAPFENIRGNNGIFTDIDVVTIDVSSLLRIGGQVLPLSAGVGNIGGSTNRFNGGYFNFLNANSGFTTTLSGRVNFGGAIGAPNGSDGLTRVINITCSGGTSGTLTVSAGIITACSCP